MSNHPEEISIKDHLTPEDYLKYAHRSGRTVRWGAWPETPCPFCGNRNLVAMGEPGNIVAGIAYGSKCPGCEKELDYGIALSELRVP